MTATWWFYTKLIATNFYSNQNTTADVVIPISLIRKLRPNTQRRTTRQSGSTSHGKVRPSGLRGFTSKWWVADGDQDIFNEICGYVLALNCLARWGPFIYQCSSVSLPFPGDRLPFPRTCPTHPRQPAYYTQPSSGACLEQQVRLQTKLTESESLRTRPFLFSCNLCR